MFPSFPYSGELIAAIEISKSIAKENRHHVFSGCHLLKALMNSQFGLVEQLEGYGVDVPYIKDWADVRISMFPKAMQASSELEPDRGMLKLVEVADMIRLKLNEPQISNFAAFTALSRPHVVFTEEQLKSFPVTEPELLGFYLRNSSIQADSVLTASEGALGDSSALSDSKKFQNLNKFCIDKTALAREGKIDPIIGREAEIRRIGEILSRRTKRNAIIVGEPGVGKTALVDGFALNIINNEVPYNLRDSTLLELDVGALIAGASYKGELEDRLKKVLKEVKLIDRHILFIDEVHTLMADTQGSTGGGAVNLLKPDLARGELKVIGATTFEEYRRYIEKDEAFARRFEVLRVEEPEEEAAIRMLKAILPKYEEHHEVQMIEDSIEEAVKLAKRYFNERSLPDTAVDLMDKTMAAIRLLREGSMEVIENLEKEFSELLGNKKETEENTHFKELIWFEGQINHRLSPILIGQLEEEENLSKDDLSNYEAYLQQKLIKIKEIAQIEIEQVVPQHIASMVSHSTGIPLGKIQTQEMEKLLNMENELGKRVIGQSYALNAVTEAVREARAGLREPGKPVGSFFFLGPTGTGKTELAKALANLLFNDDTALIRFDMSEFKGEHSGSGLLGAPPGYVGYENGGPLVNKIREKSYAIVLFDEIEKADKAIFDVFLKILDEGKVKDMLGKEGDFSNAIILFTSNIEQEVVVSEFNQGRVPDEGMLRTLMKKHFRPEFIARVDSIVPFSPITESSILQIFRIQLKKLAWLLENQGIQLTLSEKAEEKVAFDGFNPEFGARPLIGEIRRQLARPVSKMIIKGEIKAGDHVHVDLDEEGQLTWITNQ